MKRSTVTPFKISCIHCLWCAQFLHNKTSAKEVIILVSYMPKQYQSSRWTFGTFCIWCLLIVRRKRYFESNNSFNYNQINWYHDLRGMVLGIHVITEQLFQNDSGLLNIGRWQSKIWEMFKKNKNYYYEWKIQWHIQIMSLFAHITTCMHINLLENLVEIPPPKE